MLPPLLLLSLDLLFVSGLRSFFIHLFVLFLMPSRGRWNSHVWPTPTATMPPTTTAATPAVVLAASGKFRRCQCGRRMSSLSYDHHCVCFLYRGCESD